MKRRCAFSRLLLILLAVAWIASGTPAAAQEWAIEPRFDDARTFNGGAAPVMQDGLWGLIDRNGEWIVRPVFEAVDAGGMGRFGVEAKGRWGYVDARGTMVIDPVFESVRPFDDGVAAVKTQGMWGYVVPSGVFETEPRFLELGGREGEIIAARDADGWALFRAGKQEETHRSPVSIFDEEMFQETAEATRLYTVAEAAIVAVFPDGERLISISDAGGYTEISGSRLFHSVRRRSEGFAAAAATPGRWGYIHRGGDFVWEGRFEDADIFSEGFAAVKSGGKWGYIGRDGEFAVEPEFDRAYAFRDGFAIVRIGEKRGFLQNGETGISVFVEPRYEDAYRFSEGLAPVKSEGKWGYISSGKTRSQLVESPVADLVPR
jgi:hypothetical protein